MAGSRAGTGPTALLRAALACVVTGWALLVAYWAGLLFVVGEVVVPGWAAGGVLTLAATAMLMALRGRARYTLRLGPWVVALGTVSVLTATHAFLMDERWVFLSPASPQGCRAVVAESAFLVAGSGTVYTVLGVVGWKIGSYTSDDGYRPFSRGEYDVRGTSVRVRESVDPVRTDGFTLGC